MADPIKGSDVLLDVFKDGQYRTYLCATDCSIDIKTDLQSVKTIGDGFWQRYRAQSIGYTVKLSGVVKINSSSDPTALDLLDYVFNLTEFNFRMTMQDDTGAIRAVYGNASIETGSIGGGVDGFAKGDFTLFGNGPLAIGNSISSCDISVTNISATYSGIGTNQTVYITTAGTGTLDHLEYTIDGGNRITSSSSILTVPNGLSGSSYQLVVYPVCVGGIDGTSGSITIYYRTAPYS